MEQGRSGDQVAPDAGTQRGWAGVSNPWKQKAGVREKRIPVFWVDVLLVCVVDSL